MPDTLSEIIPRPISPVDWVSLGPDGGTVTSLAADPVDPKILYIGTVDSYGVSGRIFRSTDSGVTWSPSGNTPVPFVPIIIRVDPNNRSVLYAAGAGVYRSDDTGFTWQSISTGLYGGFVAQIYDLAIDPKNSDNLFVGTPWGVYKTVTRGASWFRASAGLPTSGMGTSGMINVILIDITNSSTIFAGGTNNSLFKSIDGGQNWHPANNGIGNATISVGWIAQDFRTPQRIYTGTTGGIFKTEDAGNTWIRDDQSFPQNQDVYDLAFSETETASYALCTSGLFKRSSQSPNWVLVHTLEVLGVGHDLVVSLDGTVFVIQRDILMVYFGKAFKFAPVTSQWTPVQTGIRAVSATIFCGDSKAPANLFLGTRADGFYRSQDAGNSWTQANSGLLSTSVSDLKMSGSGLLAATDRGVFKSLDVGVNWQPTSLVDPIGCIAVTPAIQSTIFAGGNQGLYKSVDSGQTWAKSDNGISSPVVTSILVDPFDPTIVVLVGSGMFRSTNGGISWTPINLGFSALSRSGGLVNDPNNSGRYYAGFLSHGVYVSFDHGVTWAPLNSGLSGYALQTFAVQIDPSDSNRIYRGTNGAGLLFSANGGLSWTDVSSGLPNVFVDSLTMDQSTVYAGISGSSVYAHERW